MSVTDFEENLLVALNENESTLNKIKHGFWTLSDNSPSFVD